MKYDRIVIGYHGCDVATAELLLGGGRFTESTNDYDWLGRGIYFWEYGADRALRFAEEQVRRGRIHEPTIVGALIQLAACFDLMDTRFTKDLSAAFAMLEQMHSETGADLPQNAGGPDKKLRRLDCAVLNFYLSGLAEQGLTYDTVRCGFVEGGPAFAGSGIQRESHVQIAVRNPACIVGVFRPTMYL